MCRNVGMVDRVMRLVVGVALIAFAMYSPLSWAWIGWIGVVPIITALVGYCPAYSLMGCSSCKLDKS